MPIGARRSQISHSFDDQSAFDASGRPEMVDELFAHSGRRRTPCPAYAVSPVRTLRSTAADLQQNIAVRRTVGGTTYSSRHGASGTDGCKLSATSCLLSFAQSWAKNPRGRSAAIVTRPRSAEYEPHAAIWAPVRRIDVKAGQKLYLRPRSRAGVVRRRGTKAPFRPVSKARSDF